MSREQIDALTDDALDAKCLYFAEHMDPSHPLNKIQASSLMGSLVARRLGHSTTMIVMVSWLAS
jgi:hypothetical protein